MDGSSFGFLDQIPMCGGKERLLPIQHQAILGHQWNVQEFHLIQHNSDIIYLDPALNCTG